MTIPYSLRELTEDDKAFIFTSWIKSNWKVYPNPSIIADLYLPEMREMIGKLLDTANTLIVCASDDRSHILGFVVFEYIEDILHIHYLYIKNAFRNVGLARSVISAIYPDIKNKPIVATSNFILFQKLKANYMISYNPFFIPHRLKGDY